MTGGLAAVGPDLLVAVMKAAVALGGAFVAVQAYRGYRRHGVATMRFVAVGIVFLTVAPVAVSYGLPLIAPVSDALSLLVIGCSYLLGLAAIDYALNYA